MKEKTIPGKHAYILQLLPTGEENAIHAAGLARAAGISSERMLRMAITALRRQYVICSSRSGYYLPGSREEVRKYEQSARRRGLSAIAAGQTARKRMKQAEGQASFNMGLPEGREAVQDGEEETIQAEGV